MLEKLKKQINLENYFLLVIFILPAYLLRFSISILPTNLWEALAIVAIILAVWKAKKENNFVFFGYEKKTIFLFLIIILGLVLGMMKSGDYRTGLGIIKGWFAVPFTFAFLANKIIENKKKAYFSLFLSCFLVASVALTYKILGVVTFDGRLQAFYNSPNYLAMYIAPGIIIGMITLAQSQKSKVKSQNGNLKVKTFYYFSVIATGLILFFTYSYAAWASVLVSLIIILLLGRKISRKYLIILILMTFALVSILRDTTKFNDLVNLDSRSSFASRMMIWESTEKILSDSYIIGIGPGNFEAKYLEYQKYFPAYLEWAVPHPHNLYLAFWLNTGLIGLLSFLAILYLFFRKIVFGIKINDVINIISLGIIIYFLLHGLVDTTYFKNDLAVVFWLAIFL